MKCALVSPVDLLQYVKPFSNYHLILTHLAIYNRKYQEFYKERSKEGDFIVLDNSAVEKGGRSTPLKDVVLAAVLTKPSVVVLPDFLFDSKRTLRELETSIQSPALHFLRRVLPDVKLCVVVQGVDEDDWLQCFDILNGVSGIDYLGIPKVTGSIFGSRWACLERIKRRVRKPCHLLGVWWQSTLDDIRREGTYNFVVGIDTPKPLRLAAHGLSLDRWAEMPRGKDFVDRPANGINVELLERNCREFVEICSGSSRGA